MLFADSTSAAPTTTPFIQIALVIFLAVFVGIALWVILSPGAGTSRTPPGFRSTKASSPPASPTLRNVRSTHTMANYDHDRMLDHDYDGIREYDNPLPGWWKWLFIGTIVYSVPYMMHYHLGMGPSLDEAYQAQVAAHVEKLLAALGEIQADDPTIVRFKDNEQWMSAISGVFSSNCATSHGADGGGDIGPNLTDDFYKSVQTPADLFTVISEGVPGTSMPPWKDRLREPQMILLASYVASLRGQPAANPKAAEGSRIDPWPEAPPAEDPPANASAPGDGDSPAS